MLSVTIKVNGSEEVINKLRRLGTGLKDFGEAFGMLGSELANYYSEVSFSDQGGNLGVRWPTLAASTVKYKLKYYPQYATKPLVRTGTMQGSFRSEASAQRLRIFNTAPYYIYHQSTEARTKIPWRPMMLVNDDAMNIIKKILIADIERKIEAA